MALGSGGVGVGGEVRDRLKMLKLPFSAWSPEVDLTCDTYGPM